MSNTKKLTLRRQKKDPKLLVPVEAEAVVVANLKSLVGIEKNISKSLAQKQLHTEAVSLKVSITTTAKMKKANATIVVIVTTNVVVAPTTSEQLNRTSTLGGTSSTIESQRSMTRSPSVLKLRFQPFQVKMLV